MVEDELAPERLKGMTTAAENVKITVLGFGFGRRRRRSIKEKKKRQNKKYFAVSK